MRTLIIIKALQEGFKISDTLIGFLKIHIKHKTISIIMANKMNNIQIK